METLLIIIVVIIAAGLLGFIYYTYLNNKMSDSIIRIDEAEARIDNNLRDKFDLLNRSISLFKGKIDLSEDAFKEIIKLRSRKMSNFELDRILAKSYIEYLTIIENNPKLRDSDEIYKASKQLILIDEELITLRNYYNGNISNYNKMVKKFPTSVIAKMKNYKEKLFYDLKDMQDDDHEDFKL